VKLFWFDLLTACVVPLAVGAFLLSCATEYSSADNWLAMALSGGCFSFATYGGLCVMQSQREGRYA
jgi:hypothetical protein